MLMQAAVIVDNACQMVRNFPNEPKVVMTALKCIDAITDLGIGLPIQYMTVISELAASDHAETAKLAQKIYTQQQGDMLFGGKGLWNMTGEQP